jgi:processive 1,2-diacylglycerol beta-glucosyltransferase
VVICGNNRKLLKRLQQRFIHDNRVRIFGHVRSLARFMGAADLLISKPGGLTMSEAMAKGLPTIIISPIPGQEERNARYFCRHGAAERAETSEEVVEWVETLFSHPQKLAQLKENAFTLARPRAAMGAAESILELIGERVAVV